MDIIMPLSSADGEPRTQGILKRSPSTYSDNSIASTSSAPNEDAKANKVNIDFILARLDFSEPIRGRSLAAPVCSGFGRFLKPFPFVKHLVVVTFQDTLPSVTLRSLLRIKTCFVPPTVISLKTSLFFVFLVEPRKWVYHILVAQREDFKK